MFNKISAKIQTLKQENKNITPVQIREQLTLSGLIDPTERNYPITIKQAIKLDDFYFNNSGKYWLRDYDFPIEGQIITDNNNNYYRVFKCGIFTFNYVAIIGYDYDYDYDYDDD